MTEGWAIVLTVLAPFVFGAGAAVGAGLGDAFHLWLKQRHELKLRALDERKRWLEKEGVR